MKIKLNQNTLEIIANWWWNIRPVYLYSHPISNAHLKFNCGSKLNWSFYTTHPPICSQKKPILKWFNRNLSWNKKTKTNSKIVIA